MHNEDDLGAPLDNPAVSSISWEASEYEHHEKDFTWTLLLVAATVFLAVVTFFILRDLLSVLVIGLMSVAVGIYGHREPRTLTYQLNNDGIMIGERLHNYDLFKSFSLITDISVKSIVLQPLKRLMPPITIYFSEQDEEHITQILSSYLPYSERKPDNIEKLTRRLRF